MVRVGLVGLAAVIVTVYAIETPGLQAALLEGYPFLRLLVTSKAGERLEVITGAGYTNLPVG
jgi:hypothetical protein